MKNNIKDKIIFVYNADSSVFAQVSDAVKKVATPDTYQCNLCRITYGAVSMKDEWKAFLDTLPFEKEFLHRDEFGKKYPELSKVKLPAIFMSQHDVLHTLASASDINMQKDIEGLKMLVNERISGAKAP